MLALGEGLLQIGHVGVVGGEADRIDVQVGEHLVIVGADLFAPVF